MAKKLKPPQHLIEKHGDVLQRMAVCIAKAELARKAEEDVSEGQSADKNEQKRPK